MLAYLTLFFSSVVLGELVGIFGDYSGCKRVLQSDGLPIIWCLDKTRPMLILESAHDQ